VGCQILISTASPDAAASVPSVASPPSAVSAAGSLDALEDPDPPHAVRPAIIADARSKLITFFIMSSSLSAGSSYVSLHENNLWNPFHTLVQNNRRPFCGEWGISAHADLSGWNQNVEPVPYFILIVSFL
jgi:hypothetical protein